MRSGGGDDSDPHSRLQFVCGYAVQTGRHQVQPVGRVAACERRDAGKETDNNRQENPPTRSLVAGEEEERVRQISSIGCAPLACTAAL